MENKNSKARMQVIFGALLFALVLFSGLYVTIVYPKQYIVLIVIAAGGLGSLYLTISGILKLTELTERKREEQYESIFKSEKASYLMLKKNFEEIEEKLQMIEGEAKLPTEEIINAQKTVAKVIINRSRENTEALIRSNELVMDQFVQLTEKLDELSESIDNNREIINLNREETTDIVRSIKEEMIHEQRSIINANEGIIKLNIKELIVQMKDMELRINNAISQSQKLVAQSPIMAAPVQMASMSTPFTMETPSMTAMDAGENSLFEEVALLQEEMPVGEAFTEEAFAEEVSIEDLFAEETPAEETFEEETPAEEISAEEFSVEEVAVEEASVEEVVEEASEEVPPMPDLSDPNKMMSPDDIAALLANIGGEEATEEVVEEALEEAPPMPDLSDPNKVMSPDDIAALFANMGGESTASAEPEPIIEPEKPPMPDLSDPNKALSPDEIAALFANMS